MAEFLYGDQLSQKIREIFRGENVRCAVAFWGRDAVKELFGTDVLERDDVHVVCDLSMGGTNPATLRAFGAPDNQNIRFHDGLHAKVFLSENGAIVGSANASNNGIGFMEGDAPLTEAGIFIEVNSEPWQKASEWFKALFSDRAQTVDTDALNAAQLAWDRRCGAGGQRVVQERLDFLGYDPNIHELVYVLWYCDAEGDIGYSEEGITELNPNISEYTHHMSPADDDLRGSWICHFRINARNGLADGRMAPRLFFANTLVHGAVDGDPGYDNLLGESPHGIRPDAPFSFDDNTLVEAFRRKINNPDGPYAILRGAVDENDEVWLARDHVELMHRFWRDVQDEYRRRLQDEL